VSADDRLRNTGRVTYFRDIGRQGPPLLFGEYDSCVRTSVAAGIAGLAASASPVPAKVSSAVNDLRGYPARRQPAHSAARHAA